MTDDIVEAVLKELEGRAGFDGWWGGIDDEIQDEIRQALREAVERATQPTAPSAPTELSQRVAAALEKSKPLVAEALRMGRSISGTDPTLAGVVIAAPSLTVPGELADEIEKTVKG